ncbi:MAG: hypothetical protein AAF684_00650 [Pseudomonadota bacterium]
MRVLIYSHDSFGLGHLRRCRRIAHALTESRKQLSVLIISGSPIIGSFDFKSRVDFVRVPGVVKLRSGEYTPLNLHVDIEDTLKLRASIIRHTAEAFAPDLFIVDKEPLGLGGEADDTLRMLKARGTTLALGLRDVMDDPETLATEWARKGVGPALAELYDSIWIYGVERLFDPLHGVGAPERARRKSIFTGYLKTVAPQSWKVPPAPPTDRPYLLITPGGGGDGEAMVDAAITAYETRRDLPLEPVFLFGPFMPPESRDAFSRRIDALGWGVSMDFHPAPEYLMACSAGMFSMCGYNTFCDILSFDRPAVLAPRETPRREQHIRATRAEALGLMRVVEEAQLADVDRLADHFAAIVDQPPPSRALPAGWMDGLDRVCDLTFAFAGEDAPLAALRV